MTDVEFNEYVLGRPEGFREKYWEPVDYPRGPKYPKMEKHRYDAPLRFLDVRYDQTIGQCGCLPGRDIPKRWVSIHYTCMEKLSKPCNIASSEALYMKTIYNAAESCLRYYYVLWWVKYTRALGFRPPPLHTGNPVPIWNSTHDEHVKLWRLSNEEVWG
jgi:hypothetical protein